MESGGQFRQFSNATDWTTVEGALTLTDENGVEVGAYPKAAWLAVGRMQLSDEAD